MSDLFGDVRTMKALSLWQPWATLTARGLRAHETRSWFTPYRGEVAIHASKTLDLAGAPAALCHAGLGRAWWDECPLGAVVAIATIESCKPTATVGWDLTRADLAAGNFTDGRFAWRLTRVRAVAEPIPALGRQGLFNWSPPDDLADRLGPVLDHVALTEAIGWGLAQHQALANG